MSKFCTNCGNPLIEGSVFCDNCGNKIGEDNINNLNNVNYNNQLIFEENKGFKTSSLVLGIISIVLCLFLNVLIIPLAVIGLILGIVYSSKTKKFCAGIVLNSIGIIIPIVICMFLVGLYNSISNSIHDTWDDDYNSYYDDDYYEDDYYEENSNFYDDDNNYYENNNKYDDVVLNDNTQENSNSSEVQNSYFKMINFNDIKNLFTNKENFIIVITQTGCSHCVKYKPKVESVANKHKINIYYIEYDLLTLDEKKALSNYISFDGTPTTEFFNNGVENQSIRIVGNVVSEEEFEQILIDNNYIK